MAMATWLNSVTDDQITQLREDPKSVDLQGRSWFSTNFGASLNYFITGVAYPGSSDHPLWMMLDGAEWVKSVSFENGGFGLVQPELAPEVLGLLEQVDTHDLGRRIADADFDDLINEHELEELENIDAGQAPELLVVDFAGLVDFYRGVVQFGSGVFSHTS